MISELISAQIEQVARDKIRLIDVPTKGHEYFTHGFARFGPWETKEDSVIAPGLEDIHPEIDRLRLIFRHGLLSPSYAKTIGVQVSRNWSDPNNDEHISLVSPYTGIGKAISFARTAAIGEYSFFARTPPGSFFMVFIDPTIETHGNDSCESCYLRKNIVTQNHFLGIGGYQIEYNPEIVVEILRVMLEEYRETPELVIPIYDVTHNSPDLLWPIKRS